jgi:hypothetical protein
MRHLTDLMPSVSRLLKVSAFGAISTVVAGSATMWLITGSTNPDAWLAAYDHARRCAVADAALSSQCTATVAQPAVNVGQSPPATESPAAPGPDPASDGSPAPASPPVSSQPAPAANPVEAERDDSQEGGGDT